MNASCEHFSEYFKEFGPNAFNIIHGIFSTCVSQEARRQKVSARVELIAILVIKIVFTISHFVIDSNQWENAWENWHNRSGARSYCLLLSNVFLLKNCFIKRKKKNALCKRCHWQSFLFSGHIVPLLHVRQLWASAIFVLTLYIFWMQRPTHSRSSRIEATSHRTRAIIRHDLLSCMQRLYIRSRMLCNGWKAPTKRSQVNEMFAFAICCARQKTI